MSLRSVLDFGLVGSRESWPRALASGGSAAGETAPLPSRLTAGRRGRATPLHRISHRTHVAGARLVRARPEFIAGLKTIAGKSTSALRLAGARRHHQPVTLRGRRSKTGVTYTKKGPANFAGPKCFGGPPEGGADRDYFNSAILMFRNSIVDCSSLCTWRLTGASSGCLSSA